MRFDEQALSSCNVLVMDASENFLGPVQPTEQRWIVRVLHNETVGGALLLLSACLAVGLANSGLATWYHHLLDFSFGPSAIDFRLSLGAWIEDGLLAIFFFVAGVELKHEIHSGTLATPRLAAVPICAALGGMATSGAIFMVINSGLPSAQAWGLPISTDIAFALAVLAVVGRGLPLELRAFLLTLAVVNDLGAMTLIALFYSHEFKITYFVFAVLLLGFFGFLQAKGIQGLYIYIPLAIVIWGMTYQSGIHATVSGIAMGMLMRVNPLSGENQPPGDRAEAFLRPISAGLCAPLFAFTAAGVSLAGVSLSDSLKQPLTLGVLFGLILGQPFGVTLAAFVTTKFTRATLNPKLSWWDVYVVGSLASIGFTVALLINEVTFADSEALRTNGQFAIVLTNIVAIVISGIVVTLRLRVFRRKSAKDS